MKIAHTFHVPWLGAALLGLVLATASGCDDDGSSTDGDADFELDEVRARAAVLAWGECSPDDCGQQASVGNCWCDDLCEGYGDCCDNKVVVCDGPGEGDSCGGWGGIECGEGFVCVQDPGTCELSDAGGTCQFDFNGCPDVDLPVCGCDNVTYGNACEAQAVGVAVDYEGDCGQFCGGVGGLPCPLGQHCELDSGEVDAAGHCEPGAGEGTSCGGLLDIACATDLTCVQEPGTCNQSDPQGICTALGAFCIDEWAPVCGCDGQTYSNACEAAVAEATVDVEGVCPDDSCAASCGERAPGGCWCDNLCTNFGDCCSDYDEVCE